MDNTYKIVRFYQDTSIDNEIISIGLTLEEAREHCASPETSSRTCTLADNVLRTTEKGDWFDGYTIEEEEEEEYDCEDCEMFEGDFCIECGECECFCECNDEEEEEF